MHVYLLADDHIILFLNIHHIIIDAWSMNAFYKELFTIYRSLDTDQAVDLVHPSIQYADFAQWQRDWLTGTILETQFSYWKEQLKDIPILELPIDYQRPPYQTFRGSLYINPAHGAFIFRSHELES